VHKAGDALGDLDTLNHVNNVVYLDYAARAARCSSTRASRAGVDISHMSVRFPTAVLSPSPGLVVSTVDADT